MNQKYNTMDQQTVLYIVSGITVAVILIGVALLAVNAYKDAELVHEDDEQFFNK